MCIEHLVKNSLNEIVFSPETATLCTIKKGLAEVPSRDGMSLTKLSLAGKNLPNPSTRKVWSKQIQESRKFFLQCSIKYVKKKIFYKYLGTVLQCSVFCTHREKKTKSKQRCGTIFEKNRLLVWVIRVLH